MSLYEFKQMRESSQRAFSDVFDHITQLEGRIGELDDELAKKDERIAELEDELREANERIDAFGETA